jgi:hypothetical protein
VCHDSCVTTNYIDKGMIVGSAGSELIMIKKEKKRNEEDHLLLLSDQKQCDGLFMRSFFMRQHVQQQKKSSHPKIKNVSHFEKGHY